MATVITIQPSSAPGPPPPPPLPSSPSTATTTTITTTPSDYSLSITAISRAPRRYGSSCDACLRRKSRCAMNEMVNKCYSCDFHRQECTFTLGGAAVELQSKKRKLDDLVTDDVESKRQSTVSTPVSKMGFPHTNNNNGSYMIASGLWCQSTQHIGMTTELEPALLGHLPLDQNDEGLVAASRVRKLSDDGTFMRMVTPVIPLAEPQTTTISLDAIESLVAPYGSTLVEKFFDNVHPTFPILMEDAFRQSYRSRKGISPLLLASVYVLASRFLDVGPSSQTVRRPDVGRLETTALKLLTDSLFHASISTIQAGLLLMQKSSLNTAALNAQLITAGFELGLHQDCSNWKMDTWEKGLRKRLAWALYMQDKWSSLVHGRPSHIFASNWTVQDLVEEDFSDAFRADTQQECDSNSSSSSTPVGHGPLLFCHMVALTTILSDILDRFFTLQSIEMFKSAGNQRTRIILEKAKPAQIRLKEWFSTLPTQLKMDPTSDLFDTTTEHNAGNGALHLAYFATEITLHRCIIRSLTPETADSYLSHICRSAAKTRLISAMDFVNRLRQAHLRSFWPAAARTNFALIGSFGVLLRITAPTKEEAEFYRLRLCEYRWTLSVSRKDAVFLDFALESLDNATALDKHVPEKPGIDELMASSGKQAAQDQQQQQRPRLPCTVISLDDQSMDTEEHALGSASGVGATSSVISGLASPATSISDEDLQDESPSQ